jgi:hypothetical protein
MSANEANSPTQLPPPYAFAAVSVPDPLGLWVYGLMVLTRRAMKMTIEVSDDLYRRAKAEAALRGRKLKDLVAEGLRLVLDTPRETHGRRSLAARMKSARGTVDSGVSDLATNPEHFTGFGRDARGNR